MPVEGNGGCTLANAKKGTWREAAGRLGEACWDGDEGRLGRFRVGRDTWPLGDGRCSEFGAVGRNGTTAVVESGIGARESRSVWGELGPT